MPIETTWGEFKEKPKEEPTFRQNAEKKYGIKNEKDLKERVRLILQKNLIRKYEYEEESFGASVEPKYFWLVDFLKTCGFTVEKHWETMGASVVSQFFGEMNTRKQLFEKRGMEILGSVNTVVRSIINLLYDMREFDRRLAVYNDLTNDDKKKAEEAEMTLKRVWMDEVDTRKGNASINVLSQKIDFVTIRDAFMVLKSASEADKMDLNDRVKRIVKGRLEEYEKWKEVSGKELIMRKKVERAYLVSQVASLNLYSRWAKPYLQAAQRLQFEDVKVNDANLIQAFDQNFIEIKVRGTSEKRLGEFFQRGGTPRSYSPPETWTDDEKKRYKKEMLGPPVYKLMDLTFTYRTKPAMVSQTQSGGVYRQLGKLNITFESYFLTPEEYYLLNRQEESEAMKFIEGMTDESLKAMREDIDHYLDEEKKDRGKPVSKKDEKKEAEAKKPGKPFLDQFFEDWGLSDFVPKEGFSIFNKTKYTQMLLIARADAANDAFNIYDVFKKAHGLLSFPYFPSPATPRAKK